MNQRRLHKMWLTQGLIFALLAGLVFPALAADFPAPSTYLPTITEVEKHKSHYDDPRPLLKDYPLKQILPPQLYNALVYDVDTMKKEWSEVVGFKAPDVVGKIAPEIKPGKYSYKDKNKYPGLKELMIPLHYNDRFKPGAPPYAGNFPEMEVIPTRQYYWALPVAEATKRNEGKTKLDNKGYVAEKTWQGGYPFPRPSGKFKAQQIMYNVEKRALQFNGDFFIWGRFDGVTKTLKRDFEGIYDVRHMALAGRVALPPHGWFDKRAEVRGESRGFITKFMAPRDVYGTVASAMYYLDPKTVDQQMMFIPSLRRVRKLSATDTQDPVMGQDQIYDDQEGWLQKLSPTNYPYKFEVLAEREFLVPAPTVDGSGYVSPQHNWEFRNIKFERRPMYVVQLTQTDPNYVYGKRIFYIDMETFNYVHIENYDQKGRLYRTFDNGYAFHSEMGYFSWSASPMLNTDRIDHHSTVAVAYVFPALWTRGDISMSGVVKLGK